MAEEIYLLKEQLRVKDKQIERLQGIIENLTKEEEPKPEKDPEPHIPNFWERHVKLSYAAFWTLVVVGIAVTISPWWCKSLWELTGNSFGLLYMFILMDMFAVCFFSWFQTPRGRRWLKEL